MSLFKNFGSQTYKVAKINPATGNVTASYPMQNNYWFPAMPVFPDNAAPVVSKELADESITEEIKIYLGDKVSDTDNQNTTIIKRLFEFLLQ